MEDLFGAEGLEAMIQEIAEESNVPDYNKIDYENDSIEVIRAKQAAQQRARAHGSSDAHAKKMGPDNEVPPTPQQQEKVLASQVPNRDQANGKSL